MSHFYHFSMTQKYEFLSHNSQDHVISFGAFAMYLYKDEMETSLQEALRIVKPGGHLCYTHFVEPHIGSSIGSILEPIEKSIWLQWAKIYFLENLKIGQMMYQGDRYFVCFTKRKKL